MSTWTAEALVDDIFSRRWSFLPGPACEAADVRENLSRRVMAGGLTREEEVLMLSTLPKDAEGLWLEPLDKGLSGSKVFQAKYRLGGRSSKPFVMKVGPRLKIEREAKALAELVAPAILGIVPPVVRVGDGLSLVVQEMAALSESLNLESLRARVRRSDDGPGLVRRVFQQRLWPWYERGDVERQAFTMRQLFEWHLTKAPEFGVNFPPPWPDLFQVVEVVTGHGWGQVEMAVSEALNMVSTLPVSVVHGDLHAQNVLVDELGNCWPIDFGWTRDGSSPLLDLVMLECSLKFLVLPRRSDVRALLPAEQCLAGFDRTVVPAGTPYGDEIERVFSAVEAVRAVAVEDLRISEEACRAGLVLMTYSLASHPGLNTPYVLSSLQIQSGRIVG